jgi:hypothetical protein
MHPYNKYFHPVCMYSYRTKDWIIIWYDNYLLDVRAHSVLEYANKFIKLNTMHDHMMLVLYH